MSAALVLVIVLVTLFAFAFFGCLAFALVMYVRQREELVEQERFPHSTPYIPRQRSTNHPRRP